MYQKIRNAFILHPREIAGSRLGLVQFGRFVIAGGISAGIELGSLFVMVKVAGFHYLWANAIAFIFANIVNYIFSRAWVYGSGKYLLGVEIGGFILAGAIGLLINQAVLFLLFQKARLPLLPAKVAAITFTIFWNFFSKKHIVFKT
jgi:putative flippase GtrA